MSCILKFRSLKISLETLERSFHSGEKTQICREASWDIWNSPLSGQRLACMTGALWAKRGERDISRGARHEREARGEGKRKISHGNSRNSSFLLQCRRFASERWQFSRDNGSCFDWFFWHHRGQLIFVGVSGRNSKNNGLRTGALFFSFPRLALRARVALRAK